MTGVLGGKAVVVTGAGRGLGRAFAIDAAAHGAGVVVNDLDGEPAEAVVDEIRRAGGRAVACVGSVVDPATAANAVSSCQNEFGRLDGLVNNAGLRYQSPIADDEPARMRTLIETNVLGALHCGSAAAKAMRAQGSGSIVNLASLAMSGQPTASVYAASKGAIASMTVAWAVELAEHGVRVNAICPLAHTRMSLTDTRSAAPLDQTPDRIAPIVTYLLSDRSAAVTGQLIRFTTEKLHLLRQIAAKEPVLPGTGMDVDAIAAAFDTLLVPEAFPAQRMKR